MRAAAQRLHQSPVTIIDRHTDRRRHRRVELVLRGRFLDADSQEHRFVTLDVSCGGALLQAECSPPPGSLVVCYFDDLGRVTGQVARTTGDGFAVSFNTTLHKRDKLADKLVWLLNRQRLDITDMRASERYPMNTSALVRLDDGRSLQCRVVDISLTGAGFEVLGGAPPLIGEVVQAGGLTGEVVRADGRTFGIRFLHGARHIVPGAN